MKTIHIPPLRWHARLADWVMMPIMYIVSGTLSEAPQRTHWWNNEMLTARNVKYLLPHTMVRSSGISSKKRFRSKVIPIFHLPIFGGWRHYVVLEPLCSQGAPWHVGWITKDVIGVSWITLNGPVRVLIGPEAVSHFGLNTDGTQVAVKKIGRGTIGNEGPYARLPLL